MKNKVVERDLINGNTSSQALLRYFLVFYLGNFLEDAFCCSRRISLLQDKYQFVRQVSVYRTSISLQDKYQFIGHAPVYRTSNSLQDKDQFVGQV